ncbi:MAG: hypothetical protein R3B40_14395 [Polyangiales bacterium]|nr:hypothetical protein [Myxococcales bacterium]MCB9659242.1 hypothetical protein [Sandaracinaceae bacterium]
MSRSPHDPHLTVPLGGREPSFKVMFVPAWVLLGVFSTSGWMTLCGPPVWWTLLPATVINLVGVVVGLSRWLAIGPRAVLVVACGTCFVFAALPMAAAVSDQVFRDDAVRVGCSEVHSVQSATAR